MKQILIKIFDAFLLSSVVFLPVTITISVLVLFDFITGVWASIYLKEDITSKKMSQTITKFILYNIALISGFCVEYFIVDVVPLTKIIAMFIASIELKSMFENIYKITGINLWINIKKYFKRS